MTSAFLPIITLLLPLALVFASVIRTTIARKPLTVHSLGSRPNNFRTSKYDNSPILGISLVATQLTIAGGIIASIAGIGFYGLWFFIAPLSFALGLLLFVRMITTTGKLSSTRYNFIDTFSRPSPNKLPVHFLLSILIVDIFLIGWEIYVLTIIYATYFSNIAFDIVNNATLLLLLLSLIFVVPTALYVAKGGWTQSVRTDIWQFAGVILFIVILVGNSTIPTDFSDIFSTVTTRATNLQIFFFVFPVLVINLTFPFVTLANWKIAESAGSNLNTVSLLGLTLLIVFFFFIFLIFVSSENTDISHLLLNQGPATALLLATLPLFSWSTIDAKLVALMRFLSPMSPQWSPRGTIRLGATGSCLGIVICAVLFTFLLRIFSPDILQALLAAVGALIVFVPPVIALLIGKWSIRSSQPWTVIFLILFICTLVTGMMLSMLGFYGWVTIPATVGFFFSVAAVCVIPQDSGGPSDEVT